MFIDNNHSNNLLCISAKRSFLHVLINLRKEFSCVICLQIYKNPVTLKNCQHNFCLECLKKLYSVENKSFKCPICKRLTSRRSYYSNQFFEEVLQVVEMCDKLMDMEESTEIKDSDEEILRRFLNDCVSEINNNNIPFIIDDDIQKLIDGNDLKTQFNEVIDLTNSDNFSTPEIREICNTGEKISIINCIEEDFLNKLEKETSPNFRITRNNKKNKIMELTNDEPKIKRSKRQPKVNKKTDKKETIKKETKKVYKRLKVKNIDIKNKKNSRTKLETKKKNDFILDDFDELNKKRKLYLTQPKINSPVEDFPSKKLKNDSDEEINNLLDHIDVSNRTKYLNEIFEAQTQVVKTNDAFDVLKNDSVIRNSDSEEIFPRKIKTIKKIHNESCASSISSQGKPFKIFFTEAQFHHRMDSDLDQPIKKNKTNASSSVQQINNNNNSITDLKNEIKFLTEKQSSMVCNLKSTLSSAQIVISQCNNYSESLFSENSEIISENPKKINSSFHSLPDLTRRNSSNETIQFFNTAIPSLKKIEEYFDKITNLSQELKNETDNLSKYLEGNEEISLIHLKQSLNNKESQTDISLLKCPKCSHIVNMNVSDQQNLPQQKNDIIESCGSDIISNRKKVNRQLEFNNSSQILTPVNDNKKNYKRTRESTIVTNSQDFNNSKRSKTETTHYKLNNNLDIVFCSETDLPIEKNTTPNNDSNKSIDSQNITSKYVSILEKEYREANYGNKNTILDNLFSSLENEKFFTENHQKNVSNNDVMSNSLFESEIKSPDCKINKETEDEKLDKEVENIIITANGIAEDSNGSDKDIFETPTPRQVVEDPDESFKNEFEGDYIVESTPQKDLTINRGRSRIEHDSKQGNGIENLILPPPIDIDLELVQISPLLPPLEFQDFENLKNTENMTYDIAQSTNEIDLNKGFFNNSIINQSSQLTNQELKNPVQEPKKNNLNPLVLAQNDKFSPLELIHSASTSKISTPKQQASILNYITPHKNSNEIEECTSPIPSENKPTTNSITKLPINKIGSRESVKPKYDAVIACSRLNREELSCFISFSSKLNVRCIKDFNKTVTHLVVSTEPDKRVKDHTMKYILAIAHRLWVVSLAWVKDGLAHNRLLPEESYEVLDVSGAPGPQLSRLTGLIKPLLKDFIFYISEPCITVNKTDLEDAILNLGGEIKNDPHLLKQTSGKSCIILSEVKLTEDFDQYQEWKESLNVLVADVEWLSRTVGQFQIISIRPYLLCLEDGIETLGYPYALIMHVPDTLSQLTGTSH